MSDEGRHLVEGLSAGPGKNRYPRPSHDSEKITYKEVRAVQGTDLNTSDRYTFTFTSAPNELVRFPENPFLAYFKISYANPEYNAGGNDEAKAERHYLRAASGNGKPPLYFDPMHQLSILFDKVEVTINDELVCAANVHTYNFVYQAINRILTTDGFCLRKYGESYPRVTDTDRRLVPASAASMDPYPTQTKVAYLTDFDNYAATEEKICQFGFDGTFPFSCQNNYLQVVMGKTVPNGFLKPGSKISISMSRRKTEECLESFRITDTAYLDGGNPAAGAVRPDVRIEFSDMCVVYESFTPSPSDLASFARSSPKYYVDVPEIGVQEITGGAKQTTNVVKISPKTKVAFLVFMHQNQLWYGSASGKNVNTKFSFPKDCEELRVSFRGRDGVMFENGLKNPGSKEGAHSPSCKIYHSSLAHRRVYDRPFESMFPRVSTKRSYEQILVVDLTAYQVEEISDLLLTMTFKQTSPQNLRLVCVGVTQNVFTQSADTNKFKFSPA